MLKYFYFYNDFLGGIAYGYAVLCSLETFATTITIVVDTVAIAAVYIEILESICLSLVGPTGLYCVYFNTFKNYVS